MARRFNNDLLRRMCEEHEPPVTPEQLAAGVGVSAWMARLWLHRGAQPSITNAAGIARFFHKQIQFFITDDDPETPSPEPGDQEALAR